MFCFNFLSAATSNLDKLINSFQTSSKMSNIACIFFAVVLLVVIGINLRGMIVESFFEYGLLGTILFLFVFFGILFGGVVLFCSSPV